MPNPFSPEAQKISYSLAFLGSIALDAFLVLNAELSFEDKVESRALITLASVLVFIVLQWLDKQTTIKAMSKGSYVVDKHAELKGKNFGGDKEKIKAFFKQSDLEVISVTSKSGEERMAIRERAFTISLIFFPLLTLALAPSKIKAITTNIKNSFKA